MSAFLSYFCRDDANEVAVFDGRLVFSIVTEGLYIAWGGDLDGRLTPRFPTMTYILRISVKTSRGLPYSKPTDRFFRFQCL